MCVGFYMHVSESLLLVVFVDREGLSLQDDGEEEEDLQGRAIEKFGCIYF